MPQAQRSQAEKGCAGLRAALLSWYDRHRRDLPWRRTTDPYRIWVSEVMLQQTTVKTVLPYYAAFLNRFPTLHALAEEPEEEVLAAWSGLGYYHRARNLHRGAQHVAERHAGQFPRSLEAALAVPGVGLYTASAVLSIAHGLPLPVVDGNVRRVLARLLALRGPQFRKDGPYYNRAEELLDPARPGDWNQALMELGATVCLPRQPACPACPLRQHCRARALGVVDELPEGRARRATVDVTVAAALVGVHLARGDPTFDDLAKEAGHAPPTFYLTPRGARGGGICPGGLGGAGCPPSSSPACCCCSLFVVRCSLSPARPLQLERQLGSRKAPQQLACGRGDRQAGDLLGPRPQETLGILRDGGPQARPVAL